MDPNIRKIIKQIYIPKASSHKGQNGRLLIIGGSKLFSAASLWSLEVASRIVDLVHYCSTDENNKIVERLKSEFRNGIVVPRDKVEEYVKEDDCILIGPGMVRAETDLSINSKHEILNPKQTRKPDEGNNQTVSNFDISISNLEDILRMEDEGEMTYHLTKYLLRKYPEKRWVIDAGALQMLSLADIPKGAILTPHGREFEYLYIKYQNLKIKDTDQIPNIYDKVCELSKHYSCTVLLKGETDLVCEREKCISISGGNAGMTKGGTGDVLAGLVASFYCKSDAYVSAVTASVINKASGDELYKKVGYYYNASDLAKEIPLTTKKLLIG